MKKLLVSCLSLLLLLCCVAWPALAASAVTSNDFVFAEKSVNVFEGDTVQLELRMQGIFNEDLSITYTSNNQNVATVSRNGEVSGRKVGKATITAQTTVSGKSYKATVTVSVLRPVTSVTVNETNWNNVTVLEASDERVASLVNEENQLPVILMLPGKTLSINATVLPKNASERRITITSSDPEILTAYASSVKAVEPGECVLTVASMSNPEVYTEYCVLVVTPVTGIEISGDSMMYLDESQQLTAYVQPDDATFPEVTWTSSNTRVVSIDEYGQATAESKGTATITAKSMDGSNKSATFRVTVGVKPTEIQMSQTTLYLNVSAKKTLSVTVKPSNANDKTVTWTTSDRSVATVSDRGVVTGIGVGDCTITATSNADESVVAEAEIRVVQPVTRISFSSGISLEVGNHETLEPVIEPYNATEQTVTYKSSNPKIASVDGHGIVTALKAGTATITATAVDGSRKSGTVKVQVIQPVEGVHMKSESYRIGVEETQTITAVIEPSDATDKSMTWTIDDDSIATIKGTGATPRVTGKAWGTTTVTGVTNDGGYECSATINVGNYNKALTVTDFYLQNNAIKIVVSNDSNLTIERFNFTVKLYDMYGFELPCNVDGSNSFSGSYSKTLEAGDATRHGQFTFLHFVQPEEQIGRMEIVITGYYFDGGELYSIPESRQTIVEYEDPYYPIYLEPVTPDDPAGESEEDYEQVTNR